ncbi:hypothetical protein FACS1894124_1980 [Spirochaetia bacterium]|nr:hypothetical protein FACS1894124_1980 [Spirochaetia bacterium]
MNIFFHYCLPSFTNCYILGTDIPSLDVDGPLEPALQEMPGAESSPPREASLREAVLIDPGNMDIAILDFLENNEYKLRGVLITHDHKNHVRGLRTLKRIYHVDIYAVNHIIQDHKTTLVRDGDELTIGPFRIQVISVPGHSSDSAVFKIGNMLFTGDAINAGLVGSSASSYGAAIQMTAIRSKLLSLPGDYIVLPGHGPPTTLEAERHFNAGIMMYEQNKTQRPVFKVNILDE